MSDLAAQIDRLASDHGLIEILFRRGRVGLRFYAEPLAPGRPLPLDWSHRYRLTYYDDLAEGARLELERLASASPQKGTP